MAPRRLLACALAGFLLLFPGAAMAQSQLLPQGFFDVAPAPGQGPAAVEADRMSYDGTKASVAAEGAVVMSYQGYDLRADRVDYDQATDSVKASGHVRVRDPSGNVYEADSLQLSGGMKEAFIDSLTITTTAGARITARSVDYKSGLQAVLTDASYAPCGLCVDSKGRKVGWKVKSARIIYDRDHAAVYLEQPSLELLGIPVAWIPWFWIPDPTQPRATGLRMPGIDFDTKRGAVLSTPYFVPIGEDVDLLLTPQLMSRQGALLAGKISWRFPGWGQVDVKASGLYQLDPSAFAGTVGDRRWRGAIQTAGHFTPADHWTAGWSYSTFTDQAYLTDYKFSDANSSTNSAFGTYLNEMTFFDIRVEQGQRLGNFTTNDPAQAILLPQTEFEHVQELAPGWGRLHVNGELQSIVRGADQTDTTAFAAPLSVPYVFGQEGNKQHLMLEGGWEDQYILPGGVTATPYLAARLDATRYDRNIGAIGGGYPTTFDTNLLSVTPIAAMDVRWPLMAKNGFDTHLLEPVAQLVYRGSSTTSVGVLNDDSQSFVFDTSNLFTYNHFSGVDRQDTGLQANIGGHYLGNFADGSWIDFVAGQSFHLAGTNAFGISDAAQTGTSTGLGSTVSYTVASVRAGLSNGITGAAKIQLDPSKFRVTRAGAGIAFAPGNRFSTGADYTFIAADPALGITADQHQITGRLTVPVSDYWSVNGDITYNIATRNWMEANTGLTYDDGYLVLGGTANFTPTSWGVGVKFNLKGPDGGSAF